MALPFCFNPFCFLYTQPLAQSISVPMEYRKTLLNTQTLAQNWHRSGIEIPDF